MGQILGRQNEIARIYEAVKGSLEAEELPLGAPIPITVIAKNLQVRAGPVRTVCRELVGEGWVISAGGREFLAWHTDEDHIASLYGVVEGIISCAIDAASSDVTLDNDRNVCVQGIHDKLSRQTVDDESIPEYTSELFFAIVARASTEHVNALLREIDAQLSFLRMLEVKTLDGTGDELLELCELALGGRSDELKQRVTAYFGRRYALLPKLVGQVAVK